MEVLSAEWGTIMMKPIKGDRSPRTVDHQQEPRWHLENNVPKGCSLQFCKGADMTSPAEYEAAFNVPCVSLKMILLTSASAMLTSEKKDGHISPWKVCVFQP